MEKTHGIILEEPLISPDDQTMIYIEASGPYKIICEEFWTLSTGRGLNVDLIAKKDIEPNSTTSPMDFQTAR